MVRPWLLLLVAAGLPTGCAPAEPDTAEAAAIQVAAATEVLNDISRKPGPIVVVCVGYLGDWDDGGLPEAPSDSIRVSYLDGCEEVDGQLRAQDGGGEAISVTVGPPERRSRSTATARVMTSTGSIDLAAYACTLRGGGTSWHVQGCTLEAIS